MPAANSHEIGLEHSPSSPLGSDEDANDQEHSYSGDYATRMEEVLGHDDEDEEDEGFLYQGADSQDASATYNEQLHVFLEGLEEEGEPASTDSQEEHQVEQELGEVETLVYEEPPRIDIPSPDSQSTLSLPFSNFDPGETSTVVHGSPSKPKPGKPFVHPNVSRLRSFVPQQQNRHTSSGSSFANASPSPSHFSAISRTSSLSNLQSHPEPPEKPREPAREVFRWTVLRDIGQQIYIRKATSILGSFHGVPTVLSANGLICIGTDRGRALVFDFKQQLKCVCGVNDASELAGPVSAISLSRDHTFLAVGYAFGHINLYDISRPQTPARSVFPTSLTAVASGRKEGHIEGSRIISLGFVGARHTAIVSADESGLAFYHSLGKVLFVEATDTLRILGKYPDAEENSSLTQNGKETKKLRVNGESANSTDPAGPRPWKPRKGSTILAMASLPLGTSVHPTENYNLVALLTSAKLVIVGLRPSPRTWFRRHRDNSNDSLSNSSKWRGCLAWFPSVDPGSEAGNGVPSLVSVQSNGRDLVKPNHRTQPILAYSWDRTIYLLRVSESKVKQMKQSTKNPGKTMTVEVGKVELEEIAQWSTDVDYLAMQWLNADQILALTITHLEVWDVRMAKRVEHVSFDVTSLSPRAEPDDQLDHPRIAHCMRVYKGKVFLLGRHELKVGTLLSWADRILAFVEEGDFLSAIDITRAYYLGTAPGNRTGLPDDPKALRTLVGRRMRDLMIASARYAFAEERMMDNTHITADGRGVDRTSLFEGLVTVCIDACIALGDFDFLFEDLFEYYQEAAITNIFLTQLEPYILDGTVRSVPPRITQRLIAMHEDRDDLDKAERVIWHIDPDCLDINQAITLCQNNGLYDALIYVYTRSLRDFVTPLVDLLGLIRQIQRYRREERLHPFPPDDLSSSSQNSCTQFLESKIPHAYRVYTYLADVLSGLTYPSQRPMPAEDAFQAKKDIYSFLFFGRSYVWPVGDGGKLILTSEEEGGMEPTYPYVRLLLRFDAEAFLHAMDIAFEDDYFNDETQSVSRLVVVRILLEILSSPSLSPADKTMLDIFIARNVPKYPQSIHMTSSDLHAILVDLAADPDQSTREDRQLAAEYLLSIYTPRDNERITGLFDDAGFYRIIRSWHRHSHKWGPLVSTYLRDPDIDPAEVFESLDEVLLAASRANKDSLPVEVLDTVVDAIPQLLDAGVTETAFLFDRHAPSLHDRVLKSMKVSSQMQFAYLRCLVEPSVLPDEIYWSVPPIHQLPSHNLDQPARKLYVQLLCRYDAPGVIRCLGGLDDKFFDWDEVILICEQNGVNDAVIWSLDKRGDTARAFERLKVVVTRLGSQLGKHLVSDQQGPQAALEVQHVLNELKALGDIGLRICSEHSGGGVMTDFSTEDMWFCLLGSQIDAVQMVSDFCSSDATDADPMALHEQHVLGSLRSLVQMTFTSMMSQGSSPSLSFPRLFKRLVDSTSTTRPSSKSSYSEFRLILTGILDSYRSEGDILFITNRLMERDLFTTFEELSRRRVQGSRVRTATCISCRKVLHERAPSQYTQTTPSRMNGISKENFQDEVEGWVIQVSSGKAYHRQCLPLPIDRAAHIS
ncbi:hypothetical protein K439DRAFT_1639240 [Ramaria rubella]|nr:hypothetical protein K439DRAFT_1639240 [Ramaria rubella]